MSKQSKELQMGRWVYCKYCYKDVLPIVNWHAGLVQCSECGAGLSLLEKEIKAQSLWNKKEGEKLRRIEKNIAKEWMIDK